MMVGTADAEDGSSWEEDVDVIMDGASVDKFDEAIEDDCARGEEEADDDSVLQVGCRCTRCWLGGKLVTADSCWVIEELLLVASEAGEVPGILVLPVIGWTLPAIGSRMGVPTRDPSLPRDTWSKGLEAADISGVEAADMSSEEVLNCCCSGNLEATAEEVVNSPTGLDFCLEAFLCKVVLKWRLRWPELVNHLSQASHW